MQEKKEEKKNNLKLIQLANSGLQLGAAIAVGAFGGDYLDNYYQNEKAIYTIIGSLLGVGIGLYLLYRTLIKISNEN